jgi:hypothetical protein
MDDSEAQAWLRDNVHALFETSADVTARMFVSKYGTKGAVVVVAARINATVARFSVRGALRERNVIVGSQRRKMRRCPRPLPSRLLAMFLVEARSQAKLKEMTDAIHLAHCTECTDHTSQHVRVEAELK